LAKDEEAGVRLALVMSFCEDLFFKQISTKSSPRLAIFEDAF